MNETAGEEISHSAPSAVSENGTIKDIDGKQCVYYDGYWIRHYEVPEDEEATRSSLIDSLTKRVFHHTEKGINTPGNRLEQARAAFEREEDPQRKRVNAAMLAGALLHRGSDIFTMVFEMRRRGIEIHQNNELLLECESCFLEALDLGKQVRHYSGEEGLDELWGEPLKVFYMPVAEFYESRYIKIAQSMAAIDRISSKLIEVFESNAAFEGVTQYVREYARAAKGESETMKSDAEIFSVWPEFVTTGDRLYSFKPTTDSQSESTSLIMDGVALLREGKRLIEWIAFARVPMPKTTQHLMTDCDQYLDDHKAALAA